jgi:hypothetical protein
MLVFFARLEKIPLQQLPTCPPKLWALGKKRPHIHIKLCALSVARILPSRTFSSVARSFLVHLLRGMISWGDV